MSGDMRAWGRVVGVARVGDPSRELERVVARPELRVLRLQLREASLQFRDARAERLDLGLAVGVALGIFRFLALAALDEVELSLATAAEAVVFEHRARAVSNDGLSVTISGHGFPKLSPSVVSRLASQDGSTRLPVSCFAGLVFVG